MVENHIETLTRMNSTNNKAMDVQWLVLKQWNVQSTYSRLVDANIQLHYTFG